MGNRTLPPLLEPKWEVGNITLSFILEAEMLLSDFRPRWADASTQVLNPEEFTPVNSDREFTIVAAAKSRC